LLTREQRQALFEVLTAELINNLESQLVAAVLMEASQSGLASDVEARRAIEQVRGIHYVCGQFRQLGIESIGGDQAAAERRGR